MAIEAIKGAGMVYQGSTSTAQIKEQAQGRTEEVIKEFPPEKTLDMIAKVWEMAGLMVDEKR